MKAYALKLQKVKQLRAKMDKFGSASLRQNFDRQKPQAQLVAKRHVQKLVADLLAEPQQGKSDAEAAARAMLQNQGGGELTTMGRDGRIRSKDTIASPDPNPPRDKEH